MDTFAAALAVVAFGSVAGGAGMLLRRRAVVSGAALTAAGTLLLAAALLWNAGAPAQRTADLLVGLAVAGLGSLALVTYPRPRWRHPVDSLALIVLPGAGVVAALSFVGGRPDVGGLITFIQACAFIGLVWWRLETSDPAERRALTWMTLALASTGLVYFFASFAAETSTSSTLPAIATAAFALVAPAMYVGVTLPDVVDVRGLVVSAVVSAVAMLVVLSLYVLGVSLFDALGAHDLSVGAEGLIAAISAIAFRPTRVALRGVVDQILFGERPDPLDTASLLARQIGDDPLPAVQAVREALVVPYIAVVVDDVPVATSGTITTHVRSVDLGDDARLVVGLRPGDLALTAGDQHVLAVVAPLIRLTLRAQRLTAEVQESRGRAVAALEEERRRLRRDLHDGLGPTLSGLAYTADAARNTLRDAPDDADELLRSLRADAVTAVTEVRRLVYGMRPPALDELGLARALTQWSAGLHAASGRPLVVVVESDDLPVLGAGVETAAYRIAVEALTNAARHSDSERAALGLRMVDGALVVEVVEDGASGADGADGAQAEAWVAGVGIESMRERAAEVGGTLAAGGGRVRAVLPL